MNPNIFLVGTYMADHLWAEGVIKTCNANLTGLAACMGNCGTFHVVYGRTNLAMNRCFVARVL